MPFLTDGDMVPLVTCPNPPLQSLNTSYPGLGIPRPSTTKQTKRRFTPLIFERQERPSQQTPRC